MEIKVGDKVRVSKDAPKIYTKDGFNFATEMDFEVVEIEDGCARVENGDGILTIAYVLPTKYLIKVEDEAKEPKPKYKVGDRMFIKYINKIGVIDIVMGYKEEEDGIYYHLKVEPKGVATAREEYLIPYTEPTEETSSNVNNSDIDIDTIVARGYIPDPNTFFCNTHKFDWDAYTAELAHDIAVKIVNKNMGSDPEKVGEYAVQVAKSVVEELKRK